MKGRPWWMKKIVAVSGKVGEQQKHRRRVLEVDYWVHVLGCRIVHYPFWFSVYGVLRTMN